MNLVNLCRRWGRSLGGYALRLSLPLSILGCASFELSWAAPVLPNLIGDHMVLQRAREIHIWGMAGARADIKVTLAGTVRSKTTDSAGHWSVHLPAMSAGGPFTLTIQGK